MTTLNTLLSVRALTNSLLEQSQGEMTPELEAQMEQLERELAKKPDSIAEVLADMEAVEEVLHQREAEIYRAKKAVENKRKRLKQYVIDNLLNNNLTELEGNEYILKITPTQGTLEIVDQEAAEKLYGVEETVIKFSKEKIKADLKAGINLDCAKIVQNYSLKVKVKT